MSRLPEFLVIGAMKCGTTTLFEDLRANPGIFIPEKESSGLVECDVTSLSGRAEYRRLFRTAPITSTVGEVATTYAMQPHFAGVPERAKFVFQNVKVIYIVRDPVARIISHHYHDFSSGTLTTDIDRAVRQDPRLLDYTRYATQLRPWVDTFGADSVKVLRFESYVMDRAGTMSDLFRFLGVDAVSTTQSFEQAHNVSEEKRVATAGWQRIARNPVYRNRIKVLLPRTARKRIARTVLPHAPERPDPPQRDTVRLILDELGPEVEQLRAISGTNEWWDLDEVRARYELPPG